MPQLQVMATEEFPNEISCATVRLVTIVIASLSCSLRADSAEAVRSWPTACPGTVRDMLWVWGIPAKTDERPHTLATFADASPAERCRLLDVPNVVMCVAVSNEPDFVSRGPNAKSSNSPWFRRASWRRRRRY